MVEKVGLLKSFFPLGILCFLSLCKTHSYTQTAKQLNTSQSSVSRSIIEMENMLGFQLVERQTRPIKITQSGLLLEKSLLTCQSTLEQMLVDIRQNNLVHMPFRIGIIESMADCLTRPLFQNLNGGYANALALTAVSTRLLESLDEDRVDFIVSSNPFSYRNDLKRYFVFQEPSIIVTPKSVVLPRPLTWQRLQYCGLPQISYDRANSGAAMERRLFNENGLNFIRRIEVDLNALLMGMVANNMGWALTRVTSLVQFPDYGRGVNVYEMPDPLASKEVFLIYKNDAFSEMAEKIAREIKKVICEYLIPQMLNWAPWLKPYLFVQGQGPLDRIPAFPDERPSRLTTVF